MVRRRFRAGLPLRAAFWGVLDHLAHDAHCRKLCEPYTGIGRAVSPICTLRSVPRAPKARFRNSADAIKLS